MLHRRHLLLNLAAAATPLATTSLAQAAHAAETPNIDAADLALRATLRNLDFALENWQAERNLIQLSKPGKLQAAANTLTDKALDSLSKGAAAAEYKKRQAAMLTFIFLASGASKYESDPNVAIGYAEKARLEAVGARAALVDVAGEARIQLESAL